MMNAPHKPVLIDDIIKHCAPISGIWLDGTFGAGGYSRALIEAGAQKIIALDRDPLAHEMAQAWIKDYDGAITLHHTEFSQMAQFAPPHSLQGVVLDIGVSSMQLDQAERGFSFMHNGPLDMRMSQSGRSAADIVNSASAEALADILYLYGEERASRRIARAIVEDRKQEPFTETLQLASLIERIMPRAKPHEPHPATRSFQALRIAVNSELDELRMALEASLTLLGEGGVLVVVTFHSLEDRIVKQFFTKEAGKAQSVNRYQALPSEAVHKRLEIVNKKPIMASEAERLENPRARSAKLRIARRTGAKS